jgi:hypothetical protein
MCVNAPLGPRRSFAAAGAGTHDALPLVMLDSNTARDLIKPHMPVVCSNDGQFATVDHIEGHGSIKLAKDDTGQHHYIPLEWVTSVDDKVHIDRPGQQAMSEWTTTPPKQ